MCQLCTSDFSLTNRRHHCRACGRICCTKCSKQKYYLSYSKSKQRVCKECYKTLTKSTIDEPQNDNSNNLQTRPNQVKLSLSDPTLNNLDSDDLNSMDGYSEASRNLRRNSSNQVSFCSRTSKLSIFFADDKQQTNEENLIDEDNETIDTMENNSINGSHPDINKSMIYDEQFRSSQTFSSSTQLLSPQPEFQRNLNIRQSGRKRIPKVLTEISANERDYDIAGYMLKRKGKKNWRKFWFILKSHVLYSFKESEDIVATESLVILGYDVKISEISLDGYPSNLILELTHKNQPVVYLKLEDERCVNR